jgi:hypothetical protein
VLDCPFAGRVRAVFLNSGACNLMASRDQLLGDQRYSGIIKGRCAEHKFLMTG